MVAPYDAPSIEARWQLQWEADELYRAAESSAAPKWYALAMFPYTSGDLHIGHWYAFTPADAHARLKRMQGFNVMQPVGFDAFGLPAENAALKHGTPPAVWTMGNVARMREQFRQTGGSFDWSREIVTCLPSYYHWTQWLFVQFFNHGLAYRGEAPVNWCPSCRTVLANEQVIEGTCERCGSEVVRQTREQWFFRITDYAEELLRFDGLEWPERIKVMQTNWIGRSEDSSDGTVQYRLRDWLVSRQRYWGAPIPIVYCPQCGARAVPEKDLPVRLPVDVGFVPTGESPLRLDPGFRRTTCPVCGGPAERETDTLDTFVDSSWYFLRYCSPHETARPWDPSRLAYWAPVDQYTGGAEHATLHLLYARFVVKALRDLGWLNFGEPFVRLYNQGLVISAGAKMSKSRGNVVNPEDLVMTLGADTVRAYLMFLGPWNLGGEWSDRGIRGIQRFLVRVWNLVLETKDRQAPAGSDPVGERAIERLTHRTIARVTDDLQRFRFNTQLAALMEYQRELGAGADAVVVGTPIWREAIRTLLLLLAPSTPFIAEELWFRLGLPYSIHRQPWPIHRPEVLAPEEVTVLVQVNGKVRDRLAVAVNADQAEVERQARARPRVQRFIDGHGVKKVVYIPDTLINLVTD